MRWHDVPWIILLVGLSVFVLANIALPYKEDIFQKLIALLIRKPILDNSDR